MLLWYIRQSGRNSLLAQPNRLVFSSGGPVPAESSGDLENERRFKRIEGRRMERADQRSSSPERIEAARNIDKIRLGIREEVAANVPDDIGRQIHEARVHSDLREFVQHHYMHKANLKGGIIERPLYRLGHRIWEIKSKFFGGDAVDARVRKEFGESANVADMKATLADPIEYAFKNNLSEEQRKKIAKAFRPAATPASPATPSAAPAPAATPPTAPAPAAPAPTAPATPDWLSSVGGVDWTEVSSAPPSSDPDYIDWTSVPETVAPATPAVPAAPASPATPAAAPTPATTPPKAPAAPAAPATPTPPAPAATPDPVPSGEELWDMVKDASYTQLARAVAEEPSLKKNENFVKYMELRRIEADAADKMLSLESFDGERLQKFRNDLIAGKIGDPPTENQALKEAVADLTKNVLKGGAWDLLQVTKKIDQKFKVLAAQNKALLVELEFIYRNQGAQGLIAAIKAVKDKLPLSPEKAPEHKAGEPEPHQPASLKSKEEVKASVEKMKDAYAKLPKLYNSAQLMNQKVLNAQKAVEETRATASDNRSAVAKRTLVADADAKLEAALNEQQALFDQISELEGPFVDSARNVATILEKYREFSKVDSEDIELKSLRDLAKLNAIDKEQLFPPGEDANHRAPGPVKDKDGSLIKFISDKSNKSKLEKIFGKVSDYDQFVNPKKKISSFQLLVMLKEQQLKETPSATPALDAIAEAKMQVADASCVDLIRAGNNEIAEHKMGGSRGVLHKVGQFFSTKSFAGDVFTDRDVIDHYAGLDPLTEAFRGLTKESSRADILRILEEQRKHGHPIPRTKLREFHMGLQKILAEHSIEDHETGKHKKIELKDTDWSIEKLINTLQKVEAHLEAEEAIKKSLERDKSKDKRSDLDFMLDIVEEEQKEEIHEYGSLLERVKDKLSNFWLTIAGRKKEDIQKIMANKTLTPYQRKQQLSEKGYLSLADKFRGAITTLLLIDEGIEVYRGIKNWWKGRKAAKGLGESTPKGALPAHQEVHAEAKIDATVTDAKGAHATDDHTPDKTGEHH